MVEGLAVTHTTRDPFLFHQYLGTHPQVSQDCEIYFGHATVRGFPVYHIPFGMRGISYEHHLGGSRTKFSMFMGWVPTEPHGRK